MYKKSAKVGHIQGELLLEYANGGVGGDTGGLGCDTRGVGWVSNVLTD